MDERRGRPVALPADHAWSAAPGFEVVVADRGRARFEVPSGWVPAEGTGSDLALTDRPPPDDECRLEFSLLPFELPAEEGPPLAEMLSDLGATTDEVEVVASTGPLVERHDDVELAWSEVRYLDAATGAEAISRVCLVRDRGLYALCTVTLWAADAERYARAWEVLRRSVRLGREYDLSGRDPRRN
jgi:hypothetical protein